MEVGKYYINVDKSQGAFGKVFKCEAKSNSGACRLSNGYEERFVEAGNSSEWKVYLPFTEHQKEGLVEVTYKAVVDGYFGIDLDKGDNAPKLKKQLDKAGKEYTDRELVTFGELKEFFDLYDGSLWFDTQRFNLPEKFEVDFRGLSLGSWAFRDSCHRPYGAGANTADFFRYNLCELETLYLRAFHKDGEYFIPAYRAYLYKYEDEYGHAGGYCSLDGKNLYGVTSLLIQHLFNNKLTLDTFVGSDGLDIEHASYDIWANICSDSHYSKFVSNLEVKGDWLQDIYGLDTPEYEYCIDSESWEQYDDDFIYSNYHEGYINTYYTKDYVYCDYTEDYYLSIEDLHSYLGVQVYD